jgi:uncharacterized RDD family membrane protein YckC
MCGFCDAQLAPTEEVPAAVVPSAPTEGKLARGLDWRREVAHRLQAYRARRRRLHPNDSQTPLPFSDATTAAGPEWVYEPVDFFRPAGAADLSETTPSERETLTTVERMEIAVTQPRRLSTEAEDYPTGPWPRGGAASASPLLPVASLGERRRAGLLDAGFLLLAYGVFLTLFGSLGGHFAFGKFDAAVYAVTLALFYVQYFALFTVFGGSTPGMLIRGLRVVSFDGGAPTPRHLLWRSFGYLVSGGTVLLGFLWALWDEDHLTWQDRISQTYLTAAAPTGETDSPEPCR